jgi:hypothetical protein
MSRIEYSERRRWRITSVDGLHLYSFSLNRGACITFLRLSDFQRPEVVGGYGF